MIRPWIIRYEDGDTDNLTDDEAREVIRDLFGDEDDDTPRAITDGFNELRPR